MAQWMKALRADSLSWLLEEDEACPGVRYFALTQLLDDRTDGKPAKAALRAVMKSGPVPDILARQRPDGGWGANLYGAKYKGTVWSVISLWQTGADPGDARVKLGCETAFDLSMNPAGVLAVYATGNSYIHCMSGNLVAALYALGFSRTQQLVRATEAMCRMVTGDGVAPVGSKDKSALRYMKSTTPGPGFRCVANGGLPCGWGAARVLLALAAMPEARRSQLHINALDQTVEFLLSRDPAIADYPTATNPSSSWQNFGFPLFYITDYLSVLEGLALAGYVKDQRVTHAVDAMLAKQDAQGRWKREHAPRSPVGFNPGRVGQPNKWVTLRALRVIKAWAS